MSRELDPLTEAETLKGQYTSVSIVQLSFASGTVRMATAQQTIFVDVTGDGNAESFFGLGNLLTISEVEEGADLQRYRATLALAAPPELIAIALGEHYQGLSAKCWEVLLNVDTMLPIGLPIPTWHARMDFMEITLGDEATISLNIQDRMEDWERPRVLRGTDADHQARFPGDRGFEFASQAQEKQITWGRDK